ncbi:MAG TPA: hypothetical protein VN223_01755 [Candidatus Elarobacter sp.]|nr:hypothetical protein [Candidatus Elarobacter sp.]
MDEPSGTAGKTRGIAGARDELFYGAVGSFAAASVVSLLGAGVVSSQNRWPYKAIVVISFVLGTVGFVGLAVGCSLLVNETRLALRSIYEEAGLARSGFK